VLRCHAALCVARAMVEQQCQQLSRELCRPLACMPAMAIHNSREALKHPVSSVNNKTVFAAVILHGHLACAPRNGRYATEQSRDVFGTTSSLQTGTKNAGAYVSDLRSGGIFW
jgi:hypothetical protein